MTLIVPHPLLAIPPAVPVAAEGELPIGTFLTHPALADAEQGVSETDERECPRHVWPADWLQSVGSLTWLPFQAKICAGITHSSPSQARQLVVRLQSPTGLAHRVPGQVGFGDRALLVAMNSMPAELVRQSCSCRQSSC